MEPENDQSESPLLLEEYLDHHFGDTTASVANPTYVVTSQTDEPSVLSVDEPSFVGASLQDQARNKAIIDCGASESIVGSFMLQDFRDELIDLGFDANVEMSIDREFKRVSSLEMISPAMPWAWQNSLLVSVDKNRSSKLMWLMVELPCSSPASGCMTKKQSSISRLVVLCFPRSLPNKCSSRDPLPFT